MKHWKDLQRPPATLANNSGPWPGYPVSPNCQGPGNSLSIKGELGAWDLRATEAFPLTSYPPWDTSVKRSWCAWWAKDAKSCPTLCNPLDCSLPGLSVHGISQARILEWVAISFCRGSFQHGDRTCISHIGRQILYHWATREVHLCTYL